MNNLDVRMKGSKQGKDHEESKAAKDLEDQIANETLSMKDFREQSHKWILTSNYYLINGLFFNHVSLSCLIFNLSNISSIFRPWT